MNFFMEVAKLRAARCLLAPDHEGVRAEEARELDAAHALPDVGLVADRAGPVQQRRAHHYGGLGCRTGWHAELAYECLR